MENKKKIEYPSFYNRVVESGDLSGFFRIPQTGIRVLNILNAREASGSSVLNARAFRTQGRRPDCARIQDIQDVGAAS